MIINAWLLLALIIICLIYITTIGISIGSTTKAIVKNNEDDEFFKELLASGFKCNCCKMSTDGDCYIETRNPPVKVQFNVLGNSYVTTTARGGHFYQFNTYRIEKNKLSFYMDDIEVFFMYGGVKSLYY